jgi:hypothetical protein
MMMANGNSKHDEQQQVIGTSAYTLPSSRTNSMEDKNNKQESNDATASANEYEEFPTPSSPTLPWFVEYWSATFFRTPVLVLDKLCACNSASSAMDSTTTTAVAPSPTPRTSNKRPTGVLPDDTYRFDISDRSTTTSVRQRRLRQVVASYDESSIADGFYDYSSNTRNKLSADYSMMAGGDIDKSSTIMKTKKTNRRRSSLSSSKKNVYAIRKASMIHDDDHQQPEDDDDENSVVDLYSENPAVTSSQSSFCSSNLDMYSSQMLYACDSFGYYLSSSTPTTDENNNSNNTSITVETEGAVDDGGEEDIIRVLSASNTRLYQPVPVIPASPGNDTVTTISLTQSYMREFENDEDDDTASDSDDSNIADNEEYDDSRYLTMKRLNKKKNKGMDTSSSISTSSSPHHSYPLYHQYSQQSPFRHSATVGSIMDIDDVEEEDDEGCNHTTNLDCGTDDNDNDADVSSSNNSARHIRSSSSATRAYKYLIRMRPQNYIHCSNNNYHNNKNNNKMVDFLPEYYVGGVEEQKIDDESDDVANDNADNEKSAQQHVSSEVQYNILLQM